MVPTWQFLVTFLGPAFPVSHVQHVSDLHLKFALSMCRSMADIQSATAEIRRGKKDRKKKKPQVKNIMVDRIPQGDHNKLNRIW